MHVPLTVTGQENRLGLAKPAEPQQVGRIAPRGLHPFLARRLQAVESVHAGPADHADNRLGHEGSSRPLDIRVCVGGL